MAAAGAAAETATPQTNTIRVSLDFTIRCSCFGDES